ncbi:MAG: glycosyltransferase family 2 protein [Calditrichaeota bacterium]|nr:glycosyltransferase family 2 protein [Calditrichota bacterium]
MLSVSVIIPHAGGIKILRECLTSLQLSDGVDLETIIVNNGPIDDVDKNTLSILENVHTLRYECNLGFAAACNRGVETAIGKYIFLLNNDALVDENTIRILSDRLESDNTIAACQPKILSLVKEGYFDYSSAAGGEMDIYGFPFARGRVFDTLEEDLGQYEDEREIFWGAGAALMVRRDIYLESGGLDEKFFAHMEEIDMQWRIRLMGFKIMVIPKALAWHHGALTILSGSFMKAYLNQRNSLAMLFRNFSFPVLLRNFLIRGVLDVALLVFSIIKIDFVRLRAVMVSWFWFWGSLPYLIKTRRKAQKLRKIPDSQLLTHLYPLSIAWQYFVKKRRTWKELQAQTD